MQYRPLGKTGISVSEIGYGAWGIGGGMWVGAQEDESVRALRRAIEVGKPSSTPCAGTAKANASAARSFASIRVTRSSSPPRCHRRTEFGPRRQESTRWTRFPASTSAPRWTTACASQGWRLFDVLQSDVWSDEWVGRGDWLEPSRRSGRKARSAFSGFRSTTTSRTTLWS